jgi:hypothetical protein
MVGTTGTAVAPETVEKQRADSAIIKEVYNT